MDSSEQAVPCDLDLSHSVTVFRGEDRISRIFLLVVLLILSWKLCLGRLLDGMRFLMDLPSDQSNSSLSCLSGKASGWAWSFCWAVRRLNASTQLYLWPCCLRRHLTHKARWLIRAGLAKCPALTRNLLDWESSWAVSLDVNTPACVRGRGSHRGR